MLGALGTDLCYRERASPVEHEWKRKENSEKNTKVGTACNATTQAPIEINVRGVHLRHSILSLKCLRIGRRTPQFNPSEGAKSLGQWLTAVMSMKGGSDAVEKIRARRGTRLPVSNSCRRQATLL